MKKRLLACLLTAAMLVSLFPLPALAAEAERPEWMVTVFDPLDGDIAAQTVPQGGEPVLPDSLTAWAYVIEDDTAVIPPPEGLEQEDEQLPSDNAGEPSTPDVTLVSRTAENTPEPAEKQEPDIQPVTIPSVTWEAQPEFDPDAPGEYVYTPVLPAAYEAAGEVELPVISVTVTAAAQEALAALEGQENDLPTTLAGETGDLIVAGGALNTDYTYGNNTLTITTSGTYTISGTTTTDKIVIADGVTANVTLNNVNIDVSGTSNACAFEVAGTAVCNLTLNGMNTLKSGRSKAGLQVPDGAVLVIIKGSSGSLNATGGQHGAGIGGGFGAGGVITINGGTITATGGTYSAGIGGGFGAGGVITINGGTITATGGTYGAGIGGGEYCAGGTITINGGVVHAIGSYRAAGIGEGETASSGTTTIKITGGTVIAEGAGDVPGLGGEKQDCQITITGGTVNVIGKDGGPYGKGCGISCRGELNINGDALVYASAGSKPAINEDNKTNSENWKGIVFEDSSGMVYGKDVTLAENAAIPQGKTLTIPSGSKLTIPNNVELVLEGSIRMEGQLEVNGKLSGSGTVYPPSDTPISNCTVNYFDETATAGAGCQVKTDRTDWGSTVQIRPESTIYVRSGSGIAYGFQLPARPNRPTDLQAVPATAAGNDGRITGVSTAMEYRKGREGTRTPCTGTEIIGLAAGTYLIRYKATETTFASDDVYVTVRAAAPEQGFCLNEGRIYISDDGNGGIMVEQNGTEYTVSNGEIRITGGEESTPHTISVDDVTAHITLSNVKQNISGWWDSPLKIWGANVRLTLEGNNTMLAEDEAIYAESTSLTIDGPGTLTVGRADKQVSCGIYTSGANVTIDGGVLNIYAQDAAIRGCWDASLTVNGGVIRGDVSGGGRSYSGLGVSGNPSGDSIDITINGGTVELTGSNNKIYADSGTVVITGGSVTAGGVTPVPTNRTDPVYAVTVEGIGSGTVDALLLKKDGAVQAYGAPACTTTDGKVILYLPGGTYSGTAIVGGKLVNFTCEAKADGTETTTATDTGVTITTPEGESPPLMRTAA